MRTLPAAAALLVLLTALPPAQAALNHAKPYDPGYGYLHGLDGPELILVSGALKAAAPDAQGSFGFLATQGADLTGLTKVCWQETLRHCATGDLAIHVLAGGSFGFQVPGGADASLDADHAVAIFSDLSGQGDLNGLDLGPSLLAPTVGGVALLSSMAAIDPLLVNEASDQGGAIAALDLATHIEVRDGSKVLATVDGKVDPLTFAGQPALGPVHADLVVLPFKGTGAAAHFHPASADVAERGLDINRINSLLRRLYDANSGNPTQAEDVPGDAFGPYGKMVGAVFAGAVLRVPTNGNQSDAAKEFAFARTPRLEVRGTAANGLSWSGTAILELRDGHIPGGSKLYGWSFVSLPWWGWMLWVLGLGLWVARLVAKPVKANERWDRFKWLGWVVGPLAVVLVFILWDFEFRAVLGVSLLSGAATGQALLIVLALQMVTYFALLFAAVTPLRMALRNGSLLLRQGTFMGLSGAIASLLGYLVGFGILRAELDLLVSKVLASIG